MCGLSKTPAPVSVSNGKHGPLPPTSIICPELFIFLWLKLKSFNLLCVPVHVCRDVCTYKCTIVPQLCQLPLSAHCAQCPVFTKVSIIGLNCLCYSFTHCLHSLRNHYPICVVVWFVQTCNLS